MNILTVGATGFIGAEFVRAARREGHTVTGCGRSLWEEKAKDLFPDRGEYWSLSDGPVPDGFWLRADAVVLLAAKRPYRDFGFEDYSGNVRTAYSFMTQAIGHGVRNFVFASSKAVYSGGNMPWKEDACCVPSSLYGASKLAAEQLGLYYGKEGKLQFKSLRFAQVIGAAERKGYLINTLIDNARAGKTQTIFGAGDQRRQYIYIKDVCSALLAAVQSPAAEGIFNIGIPGNTSNLELAEAVNAAFHNEGNITHDMIRPMAGTDDGMDVTKAEEALGFRAAYSICETFADMAESMAIHDIGQA